MSNNSSIPVSDYKRTRFLRNELRLLVEEYCTLGYQIERLNKQGDESDDNFFLMKENPYEGKLSNNDTPKKRHVNRSFYYDEKTKSVVAKKQRDRIFIQSASLDSILVNYRLTEIKEELIELALNIEDGKKLSKHMFQKNRLLQSLEHSVVKGRNGWLYLMLPGRPGAYGAFKHVKRLHPIFNIYGNEKHEPDKLVWFSGQITEINSQKFKEVGVGMDLGRDLRYEFQALNYKACNKKSNYKACNKKSNYKACNKKSLMAWENALFEYVSKTRWAHGDLKPANTLLLYSSGKRSFSVIDEPDSSQIANRCNSEEIKISKDLPVTPPFCASESDAIIILGNENRDGAPNKYAALNDFCSLDYHRRVFKQSGPVFKSVRGQLQSQKGRHFFYPLHELDFLESVVKTASKVLSRRRKYVKELKCPNPTQQCHTCNIC